MFVNGENKPEPFDFKKHFEPAARIYCEKAQLEADLQIRAPHPSGLEVEYYIPQWHLVAEDLLDLSMKLASMREAALAGQVPPPSGTVH